MNLDSCGGCHIQPALGGTSPFVNPQVAFATKNGGTDKVPSFIRENGPVREARFVKNPDGTADGGVHAIFTITGRTGANVSPRALHARATGLRDAAREQQRDLPHSHADLRRRADRADPDAQILATRRATRRAKQSLGIRGKPNFHVAGRTITGMTNNNGNDGTIARFGWKAQNKSLMLFSGEAYNVEMGITNELFQTEREEAPQCQFAPVPNDVTNFDAATPSRCSAGSRGSRTSCAFLDAPQPSANTPEAPLDRKRQAEVRRRRLRAVPHALVHHQHVDGRGAQQKPVNLFSDLLVHDMGDGLADGVSQGEAGPREFRTAPLWGLGQRIFFLHDGRTSDLERAIREHSSFGSEANGVISNFNNLGERSKQDLLNFLRSL
jgi:hypothetical protein